MTENIGRMGRIRSYIVLGHEFSTPGRLLVRGTRHHLEPYDGKTSGPAAFCAFLGLGDGEGLDKGNFRSKSLDYRFMTKHARPTTSWPSSLRDSLTSDV